MVRAWMRKPSRRRPEKGTRRRRKRKRAAAINCSTPSRGPPRQSRARSRSQSRSQRPARRSGRKGSNRRASWNPLRSPSPCPSPEVTRVGAITGGPAGRGRVRLPRIRRLALASSAHSADQSSLSRTGRGRSGLSPFLRLPRGRQRHAWIWFRFPVRWISISRWKQSPCHPQRAAVRRLSRSVQAVICSWLASLIQISRAPSSATT
jgi:hypothetical protein